MALSMLQPFLTDENSNVVQLRLSMEQSHINFHASTKNGQSSDIVKQWFPCVQTFPGRINPVSLHLASFVEMERFLQNICESDHEIHLILEKSLSDDQDQHENLRRILAAVSAQGKLATLKCCLRENPNGFPIKTIMHMLEKCKLVRSLHIELIKQHKFDLQPLFTCLMGHTIELKVCLYNYRDDAECETTFLISPERSTMQNPRKVKPSVPDSFVHIDLKPFMEDFMKNCATPCEKCVNVQNQTRWWLDKDEGRYPYSVKVIAGLHKRPNLQCLHFGNCSLSDTQCDMVVRAIQNAPLLGILELRYCKIKSDNSYRKIFDALQTTRHGLKELYIHLGAPVAPETIVSLFKVLVAQQSLKVMYLSQKQQTRNDSGDNFADYVCYAVAKSLVFLPSITCLYIRSYWDHVSHEASLYQKLDSELTSYLLSKHAKMEVMQSLTTGVKNAKTFLAWLLLSSVNKCEKLYKLQISSTYFKHDDAAFQTFLELIPMNRTIRSLTVFGEEGNWYNDERYREMVEQLALQCSLSCPRLEYTLTKIPDHVADPKGYREITKTLNLFNKKDGSRSVLEKTFSKKQAVEVLVELRNELCCLHVALLINPAIFFQCESVTYYGGG